VRNGNHIVELMSGFPDFKTPGFDMDVYNQGFRDKNCVISAKSKRIEYEKHWGCLSLKFSMSGSEFYHVDNATYAVNNGNFLILNQDTEYSSYIDSDTEVESFTLNFSEEYTNAFFTTLLAKTEDVLEPAPGKNEQSPLFVERLYPRGTGIWPVVSKIYDRLERFYQINDEITELFAQLFCEMLRHRDNVKEEIGNINKVKLSTKKELYRRLNCARDFIDSCYNKSIDLETISQVACLNREYFIRQFKSYFKITPAQYLIRKRMDAAKHLLQTSDISITEICQLVGYLDLSSFGKLFRRYYNFSPTDLSQSFKKNKRS
jgi:AraC family transcriptional regulator